MPALIQIFVLGEVGFLQVVGQWIGKLNLQLLERGFSVVLPIDPIERLQGVCHFSVAHTIGQGHEIEIVPRGVPLEDQDPFDPQYFPLGRDRNPLSAECHDLRFQRFVANKLANPGFDPVKTAKNLKRPLHSCSLPAGDGLKLSQYVIEAGFEIGQHMVGIARESMLRMNGGGRSSDQDSIRKDALESGRG